MTDGTDTAERPARVKVQRTGVCHFSGMQTRGGTWAPGNDARCKSALTALAASTGEAENVRVDAIAEQITRKWLKDPTVYPTLLLKGAADEDESTSRIQHYNRLVAAAQARLEQEGRAAFLSRVVSARIGQAITVSD